MASVNASADKILMGGGDEANPSRKKVYFDKQAEEYSSASQRGNNKGVVV